jgi:hypothetical protein
MDFDKFFKLAFVAWVIGALVSVGVTIGLIYVICHFVAKFW